MGYVRVVKQANPRQCGRALNIVGSLARPHTLFQRVRFSSHGTDPYMGYVRVMKQAAPQLCSCALNSWIAGALCSCSCFHCQTNKDQSAPIHIGSKRLDRLCLALLLLRCICLSASPLGAIGHHCSAQAARVIIDEASGKMTKHRA